MNALETEEFNRAQKSVLKNPAILDTCFQQCFHVYQPVCGE